MKTRRSPMIAATRISVAQASLRAVDSTSRRPAYVLFGSLATASATMKSPSPMETTARAIVARLRDQGWIAYFAGGGVRDFVRGHVPKDIDIATDAPPEQVQKIFARTYAVGAKFGVIVVLENGFQFEVATFRSDDAYVDGRRPTAVHFSSPE